MENKKLYAVLLGGKIIKNNLMENYSIVFIVSKDENEARELAKNKWNANNIHIDWTEKLDFIDGYKIILEKMNRQDYKVDVNPDYSA